MKKNSRSPPEDRYPPSGDLDSGWMEPKREDFHGGEDLWSGVFNSGKNLKVVTLEMDKTC